MFLYEAEDRANYPWLANEALLFKITEGKHKDKLIEVIATQVQQDINQDNVIDFIVVETKARRVDAQGENVQVGSSVIRVNGGRHTIMQASIADGSIDPVVFIAERTQEVIEKLMNLESTVGAFSFLPSA